MGLNRVGALGRGSPRQAGHGHSHVSPPALANAVPLGYPELQAGNGKAAPLTPAFSPELCLPSAQTGQNSNWAPSPHAGSEFGTPTGCHSVGKLQGHSLREPELPGSQSSSRAKAGADINSTSGKTGQRSALTREGSLLPACPRGSNPAHFLPKAGRCLTAV